MLRTYSLLAIAVAVISAFALYTVGHQTRQLVQANKALESRRDALQRDIAILRAERAYLSRPERIKPLALKLGMRPLEAHQFIDLGVELSGGGK